MAVRLPIAFSSDECATWSPPKVVAASYGPGGRVSYPYLYERRPGELLLDGMHPNDEGHRLIAELLLPVIREQVR